MELASVLHESWSGLAPRAAHGKLGTRVVAEKGLAAWQIRRSWHDQSAAHPALLLTASKRKAIRGLFGVEKARRERCAFVLFEFYAFTDVLLLSTCMDFAW